MLSRARSEQGAAKTEARGPGGYPDAALSGRCSDISRAQVGFAHVRIRSLWIGRCA